ncbi:uncharacterized protein LOC131431406 [Malaya genurostris]|uniref:uncharacterized protein LOC131431406 n=1 Tax=Malaya genurostris TaxID=325434 RepID=UPI0026F3CBA3|nr:uncharacterized protein LOC131431406 [Malaya genurostris]
MVNLVAPLSMSQMAFRRLWAYEDEPRLNRQARQRMMDRRDYLSGLRWVWACNGEVPADAVAADESVGDKQCYIGRAHHQGSVTPGLIFPHRKACCIPWGGDQHEQNIYEVLCTSGEFVPVSEKSTEALLRASSAGVSEDGEPLFIGRVLHEGKYICGKVQRSHGVCYVAHEGGEVGFSEYQVFVVESPELQDCHYWVSTDDDRIPKNAFIGESTKDGNLYIGRAMHRGSCTPGSINPVTQQCHIAWGSDEHRKAKFEYLCNCKGKFIASRENYIPVGAIRGGYSEFGEPLFIGRVQLGNQFIIGKVQPSHKVCYVPYRGKEVAYKEFEILIQE